MSKFYTVVIDTKGSDKGPETIIAGACKALEMFPNLKICLTGDTSVIETETKKLGADAKRIIIVEAPETITNYDHPVMAIQSKQNSSLVKALVELKNNDDYIGLINAGSTGALIAGSLRYLRTPDLQRPALAAVLPASNGGFTCLVDTGANVDCTPDMLVQFAHLGSDFMHDLYRIDSPKIGLLSNGAEESKGNKLVKETHALLKADDTLNFVGNIEGTNALSGDCDVLVCDGFAGNQVLKNSEGIAKRIITDIAKYQAKKGGNEYKELIDYLVSIYDFNSLGGAIMLGVSKTVIKAHGAATAMSIVNTIKMLLNLAENKSIFNDFEGSEYRK